MSSDKPEKNESGRLISEENIPSPEESLFIQNLIPKIQFDLVFG